MSDHSLLLEQAPEDWTREVLGGLCDNVRDGVTPSIDGTRLYIGLEHIASGLPILLGTGKEQDVRSGKTLFRRDDVLFGKLRPYLRKSVVAGTDGMCSTDILVLRPYAKCIPRYLLYLTQSEEFIAFAAATTKGVQHPRTSWNALRGFELHLPPVTVQEAICRVLDQLEDAIERHRGAQRVTRELKTMLLARLLGSGLGHDALKPSPLGQLPVAWTAQPLSQCCDILSGSLSYSAFAAMDPAEGESSVSCMAVKVSDMNLPGNEIRFETANLIKALPVEIATSKLVPAGASVFPKRGAAIATNKKRMTTTWTALDPNLIALRPKEALRASFLAQWLQTFDLRAITAPGPTPQLNKKDLVPVLMPVPTDTTEQDAIAEKLDLVDEKLLLHGALEANLTALLRSLLGQLVRAELPVFPPRIAEGVV